MIITTLEVIDLIPWLFALNAKPFISLQDFLPQALPIGGELLFAGAALPAQAQPPNRDMKSLSPYAACSMLHCFYYHTQHAIR